MENAALIISAGKTDHVSGFEPQKMIGNISAIERISLLLQLSGIQTIVVVGDQSKLPQKLVPTLNLTFLTVDAEAEMLDSIKQGILYLRDKCQKLLVVHVDTPMFNGNTVEQLLNSDKDICIPSYQSKTGHPVMIRNQVFAEILAYEGKRGLKGALEASDASKEIIETEDAGILSEKKAGTSYESLLPRHDLSGMRASVKLTISKEKVFYGPGVDHLLRLTEEFGSVANACKHMGLSYSKGRKLISTMEEQLGKSVLESRQGGRSGGSSKLTKIAKQMMQSYQDFEIEAEEALEELFKKHFMDLEK